VEALFDTLFAGCLAPAERLAYGEVCRRHLGLDPVSATLAEFAASADARGLADAGRLCGNDRALWLDFLFSAAVQPHLGRGRLSFVHDYPALLPSLARRKPGQPDVVERVEVFLEGVELGNGFRELADADEQAARFADDLAAREAAGLPLPEPDERLLAALRAGLPDCSGIAIGLDRLLMLREGERALGAVLAFPWERA
jgi:lysyl-tRNA synthetase class 2